MDAFVLKRLGCSVLDDRGERLKEFPSQSRLLWHQRSQQLNDLYEHPIVAASRKQSKKMRSHVEVILRVLICQLADH